MLYAIYDVISMINLVLFIRILFRGIMTRDKLRLTVCAVALTIYCLVIASINLKGAPAEANLVISIFAVWILINAKWYEKLSYFLLLYSLPGLLTISCKLLVDFTFGNQLFVGKILVKPEIISESIICVVLLLIVAFNKYKNIYLDIGVRSSLLLSLISFFFSLLLGFVSYRVDLANGWVSYLLAISSILVLLICFWLIYLDNLRNKKERELEANKTYVQNVVRFYEDKIKYEDEIRRIKHDISNHLSTIQGLVKGEQYDKLNEYINTLGSDIFEGLDKPIDVGNLLVNAILTGKVKQAGNKGLNIHINGKLSAELKVSDIDMSVIIGNLVDNAIEYTSRNNLEVISVESFSNQNTNIIKVINPVLSGYDLENSIRHTSKEDVKNHGYGIRNVEKVVSKYHGDFSIYVENNYFICEIILI